jgi:hypothetical protein
MVKAAKKKIKVGSNVRLKADKQAGGEVVSLVGRARWNVQWHEGSLKDTVSEQTSKSLCLWEPDLSLFDAADAESEVSEDDEEPEPTNHAERKRQFDTFAQSLEGQDVQVITSLNQLVTLINQLNRSLLLCRLTVKSWAN